MGSMSVLSSAEADAYKVGRPDYPSEWFKMLSSKTIGHSDAWDVGTGTGAAAIGAAQYYRRVIATDINNEQLKRATKHPKVKYILTPESMSEDELVDLVGGENSIDLITVAQALHYFDLKKFYNVVNRVLRKPGGIIAVWVFHKIVISPEVDRIFEEISEGTKPFRTPRTNMALGGYRTISFPFWSVGIGSEGNPIPLDLKTKISLKGFLAYIKSWQLIVKAKEKGVNLLTDGMIKRFEKAWGKQEEVKNAVYKFSMIAGTCNPIDSYSNFRQMYGDDSSQDEDEDEDEDDEDDDDSDEDDDSDDSDDYDGGCHVHPNYVYYW